MSALGQKASSWHTHGLSEVLIICGPPPSYNLTVWSGSAACISALSPWLVLSNKVRSTDASLEMLVSWDILVVSAWRNIVGEADSVVGVLEVHVEQSLVGTIKRDATLCHGMKCPVVAHVWLQHHKTGVEEVWPADIWCGGEWRLEVEQLIWCPPDHHVSVHVDYAAELSLLPEHNLCEGGVEIHPVHE